MFVYDGKAKIFDHSYSKELTNIIHQSYETGINPSNHKNISYILDKFIAQSGLGDILVIINALFSAIESLFYILSTYTFPEDESYKHDINHVLEIIETIFLVYFILHFVLRLYCSQNKIIFFFNFINLIDIASSICLILAQSDFAKTSNSGYFFCIRTPIMINKVFCKVYST